jgi:predicted CXXCH cytochrome family protein
LPNTPPELCLDCHEDPREIEGALHPALEEGCLVCHDPHAGRAPGLLKGEAAHSVCLECHDSPLQGRAQTHAALSKGCSVCHDPHSSANEQFLLSPGNALCGRCHETHSHAHSLDAQLGEKYPGSAEFPRDGAEYACLGCHDPHASNERHLYSRPMEELCLMCHKVGY